MYEVDVVRSENTPSNGLFLDLLVESETKTTCELPSTVNEPKISQNPYTVPSGND